MSGTDYYGKVIYDFELLKNCQHVESTDVIVCRACLTHIQKGLDRIVQRLRDDAASRYIDPKLSPILRDIANQIENVYKEGR
jgi:hypothetical protein